MLITTPHTIPTPQQTTVTPQMSTQIYTNTNANTNINTHADIIALQQPTQASPQVTTLTQISAQI